MPFTGKLGTSDSKAANIVPAFGGSSPPPPPPPAIPGPAHHPLARPNAVAGSVPTGRPSPVLFRYNPTYRPDAQAVQAAQAFQITSVVNPLTTVVRGPWNGFPPTFQYNGGLNLTPPPPPSPQLLSVVNPSSSPAKGPWNKFGVGVRFPSYGSGPTPPPPPGPPPPPPPGTVFGPSRTTVVSVPRAPDSGDFRVRAHIDAVAQILNSLIRLGYIRSLPSGEFAIAGGGIALPRSPLATDDASVGAVVGMTYVNTLSGDVYVNTNNSSGSAVWKLVS